MEKINQKIIPHLWFDSDAEEAVEFYTSLFKNSAIQTITRYPGVGQEIHQKEEGSVMNIDFVLEGYQFLALNGGPHFKFNPSISFFVICDKDEIDHLWENLYAGGKALLPLAAYDWSPRYGWLQDRYGLNWQLMTEDSGQEVSQKICPLLFFTGKSHGKAEQAIHFYTSVFKDSEIEGILKYEEQDKNEYAVGTVKHAQFQLLKETFMAMDSGMENDFPFNEAISFIVQCRDQQEIDYYWEQLTEGGDPQAQQCGWLKDKFGVSWQVVPEGMDALLNDPDQEKANLAMKKMLKMKKIDMNALKENL
ncbi:VOC family protein [Antarcticibacterium flavum]|uniref:VOC family protein n=1 Tax=Antarcticibacterium flavum TaxID=2058175 RepID=A0A5B7X137_9FLAO|nr:MULTISPECIES: VOC family protein [Antarcticibacterium]MCM4161826.1 VOC family protein [Antarcticibacterium sp. W02-3]QCY68388.1 VOC family protein [Antarcticibacterium flavum]